MRCKNCGADNDDNRYICEVCGSPLYDESDFDNANGIDDDRTQTFKAVNEPNNQVQNRNDNYNDYDKENQYNNQKNNESEKKNKGAEKKSIIVIAVLAVILIAIIASVAAIAQTRTRTIPHLQTLLKFLHSLILQATNTAPQRKRLQKAQPNQLPKKPPSKPLLPFG